MKPPPHLPPAVQDDQLSWAARAYSSEPTAADRAGDDFFSSLKTPYLVDWVDGSKLYLLPEEGLSRAIARTGEYEPETFAFLRSVVKNDHVFMDVGANSGAYTVAASRWVGPQGLVIAVEPSLRERQKLDRNILANGASNIFVWPFALAMQTAQARLAIAGDQDAGLNTLSASISWNKPVAMSKAVMVYALDDVAHLPALHVAKVDVEGAEADFLRGARMTITRHRPVLVMELGKTTMSTYGTNANDLAAAIHDLEYDTYGLTPDGSVFRLRDLTSASEGNIVCLPR